MFYKILKKEFVLIGRSLGGIVSLLSLSLCLLFIFYSSIEVNEALSIRSVRGLKWAILFLLNFILVGQSLFEERESGGWFATLSQVSLTKLFLAKSLIIWLCTSLVNAILILVFVVFFQNAAMDRFFGEWLFSNLGSISLVFLGVSMGIISEESRMKEIVLPLLQIPFSIPLFLFGLEAESRFWMEPGFYYPSVFLLLFFAVFYGSLGSLFLEILKKES
ncbi:ABC transporter permease [Leptospira ognonensis]|uniref:ABC transporter permease n=1 Tax=Leptospira ognonensis TaxID=2484945 RepID=A0A4R9JWB3_9LEPT|nr:heme exporter protein CcmB [Leptospira ognonensis]TGL57273.1 ABC transporter permease [Leptospira ognonensis]